MNGNKRFNLKNILAQNYKIKTSKSIYWLFTHLNRFFGLGCITDKFSFSWEITNRNKHTPLTVFGMLYHRTGLIAEEHNGLLSESEIVFLFRVVLGANVDWWLGKKNFAQWTCHLMLVHVERLRFCAENIFFIKVFHQWNV
jgi:hypothetical protein